jgi:small nuclear ribonucleoprotein (snRNP)-like protein
MGSRQKDNALNLAKFIDKKILVKLSGGREGMY